ncbi:MAG: hypothetical protein HY22_02800 [[Candidatus Thermochlorobacteriaceae] bacterium GBChlB]|nr:MAG: hypothetical protein HY22_02800 [[Candidatus Thermochlorobacteriaceae] bacterium GBChlB]
MTTLCRIATFLLFHLAATTAIAQSLSTAKQSVALPAFGDAPTPSLQIASRENNKVVLKLDFDVPYLDTVALKDGSTELELRSATRENQVMNPVYKIPSFSYTLQCRVQSARVIAQSETGTLQNVALKFHPEMLSDTPTGIENAQPIPATVEVKPNEVYPKQAVEWGFAGSMRGVEISTLTVSPYIYNPMTKTLTYAKKMTVEITLHTADAQNFKVGLDEMNVMRQTPAKRGPYSKLDERIKKNAATAQLTAFANTTQLAFGKGLGQLPVVPKYRMIVNQEGVHRVGFFELQEAEFPNEFFSADPRTFRVFNKGKEVPIYVRGEQDGRFNRDDYFEFIGEPNRLAFSDPARPDMYSDPYTDENVYYFYWEQVSTPQNRGLRLVEISGEVRPTRTNILRNSTFQSTLHIEPNRIKQRLFSVYDSPINGGAELARYQRTRNHSDARDNTFWDEVLFGKSQSYVIQIPGVARTTPTTLRPLQIKVALHGLSTVKEVTPQNTANIFLGSQLTPIQIATTSWGKGDRSQEVQLVDAEIPASAQRNIADANGRAVFQISNIDQNTFGSNLRQFALNWVNIKYNRLYRAFENELKFTLPPGRSAGRYQFELNGFTTPDIDIYKQGVGKLSNVTVESYLEQDTAGGSFGSFFRAIFQDDVINTADVNYIAVSSSKKLSPIRYEKLTPASFYEPTIRLIDKNNNYNFIIITSRNFINERDFNDPRNPVFQYKQFREERLRALGEQDKILVTTVDNIYDEFNSGIKSPHAIRDFIDYAYHEWQAAPTYVLLLGDADDFADNISSGAIPTMYVQALSAGAVATDGWFVMVDGVDDTGQLDVLPEIQISRIPAASRDDVATYLAKLRRYETASPAGVWKNRLFFIAGEAISGEAEDNKVVQTDELIDRYVERRFFSDRLHTGTGRNIVGGFPQDKYVGRFAQLRSAFGDGSLVINFMGHGGGAIWSDSQLLTLEDVNQLPESGIFPFITSFTCFVGAFDGIFGSLALSEKLLFTPNKGCIGIIASSGVGWFINDYLVAQSVYDFLLNDRFQGLGIADMLFRAKTRYYALNRRIWPQAPGMMYQYNVFGDPIVRLASPVANTRLGSPRIQWNLPSHIATVGERLVIKGTVQEMVNGTGVGRITDQNNFEVTPNNIPFVVRNGRIGQLVGGQFVDSLVVQIPQPPNITGANIQNFLSSTNGGGQFKVYIQGDNGIETNGKVEFRTQAPFFRSVTPTEVIRTAPQRPIGFSVQLDARQPIENVTVRCTVRAITPGTAQSNTLETERTLFNATLNTTRTSTGAFVTTTTVPAQFFQRFSRVSYQAVARVGGREIVSQTVVDTVGTPIDVAAFEQSRGGVLQVYENPTINFYNSSTQVVIGGDVFNWSSTPVRTNVIFYENSVTNPIETAGGIAPRLNPNPTVIGTTVVQVPANGRARAEIPVPPNFQLLRDYQIAMRVIADSATAGIEATYINNLSSQRRLTYNLVRLQNNVANTITLDNNVVLNTTAGNFSRDGLIRVERLVNPPKIAQPDNRLMRFASQMRTDTTRLAYRIEPVDSALALTRPLRVTMRLNPIDSAQGTTFAYRFSESLERWLRVPTQSKPDLNTVSVDVDRFGTYALMETSDITRPIVTLGIEGQQYVPNGFAPRRSRIVAVVQDQNGVYLEPGFVRVIRNGDTSAIFQERLSIPQTTANANTVGITYSEEFQEGRQSVAFLFYDANLNLTRTDTLRFNVEDGFRLKVYGSYPNPFSDKAYISYEIIGQEQADDFEIKIYTASGRLISTYREPGVAPIGFEERLSGSLTSIGGKIVVWQGLDDKGNPVANGVYFAKIRISLRGRVLEETIKIARLQ